MTAIRIAVNVIYYISFIYMWYKVYLIVKHQLIKNKEFAEQQSSVSIEKNEDTASETTNKDVSSSEPMYDKDYMQKHGKELLIAIAFVILVLFIKGFVL